MDFNAAIALNPRSLVALQNKSRVLGKLGRTQESIKTLDQILAMYPDYVPSRVGRGVMYARMSNWPAAKADADESLRRDNSPGTVYQVACIYSLLSTKEPTYKAEAIRKLSDALRRGFGHDKIETDKDLGPIRKEVEFTRLLTAARALTNPTAR